MHNRGNDRKTRASFDYGTDNDGLISLPKRTLTGNITLTPTWFRRSQNRYDNQYDGTEKIFLYAGLNNGFATPMPNSRQRRVLPTLHCK